MLAALAVVQSRAVCSRAMLSLDEQKALAARRVVELVRGGSVVGVGSGSTVRHVIDALAERNERERLGVSCVPTSHESRMLLVARGVPVSSLDAHPRLDIAIDGLDEADERLTLIKGGGGCLLQEKIVAAYADEFVVIGDSTKRSRRLGEKYARGVPVEVVPLACEPVRRRIVSLLGGEATLRGAGAAKCGPCVTDNGNFLLDWTFDPSVERDWAAIDARLHSIVGVVETGLFVGMAHRALFCQPDGSVETVHRP